MSNLQKVKIPIAVENHSKLDLKSDIETTLNWLHLTPVYYCHMIRGQKINPSIVANVRPNPMPVPTFGRMHMNLRGFFIPYRLCGFHQWDSFQTETIGVNYSDNGLVAGPPYFDSGDLLNLFFLDSSFGYSTDVTATADPNDPITFDFYTDSKYYKLTYSGRRAYKILYNLGYDIVLGSKSTSPIKFNALALFGLVRVYLDWYANSQYLNSGDVIACRQMLEYRDVSTSQHVTAQAISMCIRLVSTVIYDSNGYFEGAWDNPVSPTNGQYAQYNFKDLVNLDGTEISRVTVTNANPTGTPMMIQNTASGVQIGTQYIHTALQKLSEYEHIHNIAGAREIDRILADFGIVSDYRRLERSIYVGSQSVDIGIGDLYATADGQAGANGTISQTGDFVGRAYGAGQKEWQFTTDEDGIFIVCASILPSGGYYQGYDRQNRHIERFDFFNPKLDGLSTQLIEKGEVYVSKKDTFAGDTSDYATGFGFTGRYGEYKRSISRVSGDVVFPSMNAGGNSWHLMRRFEDLSFTGDVSNVVHSLAFTRGEDWTQYNRIFNADYYGYDNFTVFIHVENPSYAPCKSLYDVFEFDSDFNKHVTMEANGSKLN